MCTLRFARYSALGLVVSAIACSAGGGGGDDGGNAGSANAAGTAGTGGGFNPNPLTDGGAASGGFNSGDSGPGEACQEKQIRFDPQIPTVFMLVDRSGSMFVPLPSGATAWATLRTGALQVIESLQANVRFGFGAYAAHSGICPEVLSIPPALDNYGAISELYNSLEIPPGKVDTGSSYALAQVAEEILWTDPTEGEKYILFVTDGEPDFCNDPNPVCPIDAVVGTLQRLATGTDLAGAMRQPISTIVFGIATESSAFTDIGLNSFANAGAGQPVAPLLPQTPQPQYVYDQCQGVEGWLPEFTATGRTMDATMDRLQAVGEYMEPGGTVMPFRPNPDDQAALTEQISLALAGVKACKFELGNDLRVNLDLLDQAQIAICENLPMGEECTADKGQVIALDQMNGWRMNTQTELEFVGTGCDQWRKRESNGLYLGFPCSIIVE